MIDQISPLRSAISQVGSAASAGAATPAAPVAGAGGPDFANILGSLFSDTTSTLRAAEATSIAGVKGQASTQQVVEAVMSAEQTLQAAIAIRDKVTAAYLELSRMQI